MRHTKVKNFALCDGLHMPHVKRHYMKMAGLDASCEADFELRIAGVNHFTWILGAACRGRDVSPQIRESLAQAAAREKDEGHPKARFNSSYSIALWDIFGLCPACIAHTKEYVPFWQGKGVRKDALPPLSIFDVPDRCKSHEAMWKEVDAYVSGEKPLADFHAKYAPDHATDVIQAMWAGKKGPYYINTANCGAVDNLPDNAFLELLCDLSMEGPEPLKAGAFPLGLRSLQMQVLDTHELTVEAVVKKDRSLLRRAMLTDPIVNSIVDADAIIDELMEKEADALEW
jgi:alpha-galactosidase